VSGWDFQVSALFDPVRVSIADLHSVETVAICVCMSITISMPLALERNMPPDRARLHFAIGAFVSEEVTLGQAVKMAGVSQTELMSVLSERQIPLHYGSGDFAEDLNSISLLSTKVAHRHHCNRDLCHP
jgi:predicted HTH domain antitoxin